MYIYIYINYYITLCAVFRNVVVYIITEKTFLKKTLLVIFRFFNIWICKFKKL